MSFAPDPQLQADCGRCFGLCCVALPFAESADFAVNKPAGVPCPNLRDDFGCRIHAELRPNGFTGCTVYDCFGAGQKVSQVTFSGVSWRDDPASSTAMFEVFPVMRQLHELLRLVAEALTIVAAESLHGELRSIYERLEQRSLGDAQTVLAFDVDAAVGAGVADLLRRSSVLARDAAGGVGPDHAGASLMGARLREADLRRATCRGALLVGADLRGADLRGADLLGADLRGARLDGADLRDALFLTQPQLDAARGDRTTRLPESLVRPGHW